VLVSVDRLERRERTREISLQISLTGTLVGWRGWEGKRREERAEVESHSQDQEQGKQEPGLEAGWSWLGRRILLFHSFCMLCCGDEQW
jgi:hypothetical protein